ncbi:MAG: hypothetical protein Q8Q23_03625 [bacterium]|nr:hypothetical protein [bacterium]
MPELNPKIDQLNVEKTETPNIKPELRIERPPARRFEFPKFKKEEKAQASEKTAAAAPAVTDAPVAAGTKKVDIKQIEEVLSHDLEDIYFQLAPPLQMKFKKKGEETANEIKSLMEKTKVNVRKIADLIIDWLRIIPGVNKFFLEQESKLKTDEILRLKD